MALSVSPDCTVYVVICWAGVPAGTLFGDSADGDALPTIICSSVHKAKGLEATRVFILADTVNTRNREESNIYYVAVTRAKARLTWAMPVAA